ncbi:MAG TPA: response regulator, partial [Desulfopila sp.]|nr:response regulator [Desulfopila sp.]
MKKMLIVDDDIEACETIESLITRRSHRCDMAHSLSQARTRLKQESYDVVFLDVGLPDGSGLEMLPELMDIPNAPEV